MKKENLIEVISILTLIILGILLPRQIMMGVFIGYVMGMVYTLLWIENND